MHNSRICVRDTHRRVVQLLPEGEARAVVALGVDVGQNRHEEGGGQSLGHQLPSAGLAELRREEEEEPLQRDRGGGRTREEPICHTYIGIG